MVFLQRYFPAHLGMSADGIQTGSAKAERAKAILLKVESFVCFDTSTTVPNLLFITGILHEFWPST